MRKIQLVTTLLLLNWGACRSIRYLRALPTGPLCLTCHGQPKDIPNDVASTLNELYPYDKAIGYKLGEIRGAISIKATGR